MESQVIVLHHVLQLLHPIWRSSSTNYPDQYIVIRYLSHKFWQLVISSSQLLGTSQNYIFTVYIHTLDLG